MSKKLSLTILTTAAVSVPAIGADHISQHYMNFEEYGDKIRAQDLVTSIEKSFGLDYTLAVELGYDSVSGASPSWGPTTASTGDADLVNRHNKTVQAQKLTDEVIRAGYDPHRDNYAVQKYDLEDTRQSINARLTYRDEKRNEWTFGGNYSKEEDYVSMGMNGQVLFYADSRKNRSYTVGFSTLFDETTAFQKYANYGNGQQWEDIFTGDVEVGLSQIFTPNFYTTFTLYAGYTSGYLSNHYLTVLREIDINANGTIEDDEVFLGQDSRPDTRMSGGFNVQSFYNVNSKLVVNPRYKYFSDDWGISSHQLSLKASYKITDSLSIMPGYTWYNQEGADFYRDPTSRDPSFAATGYATSDLRLGTYTGNAYEVGGSYKITAELRGNASYAYYEQTNGYEASWWSVGATYEF